MNVSICAGLPEGDERRKKLEADKKKSR